jgi:hypothetical protein
MFNSNNLLFPDNPLEALLSDLSLRGGNNLRRVRVAEAASSLAVLVGRSHARANTSAGGRDLGAACTGAVGIGDAATGDELSTTSGTDILSTRVVGGDLGEGGGGNF